MYLFKIEYVQYDHDQNTTERALVSEYVAYIASIILHFGARQVLCKQ